MKAIQPLNTHAVKPALFFAASFIVFHVFAYPTTSRSIMTEKRNLTQNSKEPSMPQTKNTKFWNKVADKYSKSPISDEEAYQKKLKITREYFKTDKSTRVLEFGCGTGGTALLHAPHVKHIHAIDFSSEMISIAKAKAVVQNIENVKFEVMGIESLSETDQTYDIILGLSVLHLLPNKDKVISKLHRLLKPGGYFVSSTPCLGDMGAVPYFGVKYLAPVLNRFGLIPQINVFTVNELKESMINTGFEIARDFHPSRDEACFLVAKQK